MLTVLTYLVDNYWTFSNMLSVSQTFHCEDCVHYQKNEEYPE